MNSITYVFQRNSAKQYLTKKFMTLHLTSYILISVIQILVAFGGENKPAVRVI